MERCAIPSAFVPHAGRAALMRGTRRAQLCVPRRRPRTHTVPRMAKFQQRSEEAQSPLGDDSSPLRPPPSALPTLSSLSGRSSVDATTDAAEANAQKTVEDPSNETKDTGEVNEKIAVQGTGLSAKQEENLLTFVKEVAEEFKVIDWPSFGRVFKITIIVVVTMIVASAGIYTVDGFFLWLSHRIFENAIA